MWAKRGIGMAGIMACLLAGDGCGRRPPPPAVAMRLVDHAGVEAERTSHPGKAVVLDCWSTSCPPCVKEFPGLVALQRRFGDRVACLSLSFDYEGIGSPEDAMPRVEEFLRQVGAGGIVNLVAREDADALYGKMGLVSVPAVFVWGPDGTLVRKFDDDMAAKQLGRPFTYEDVTQAVEYCLAR